MDKQNPQADSVHRIGLEPTLQGVLIRVENGGRGGRIKPGGIFQPRKLGTFWLVTQHPTIKDE